MIPVGFRFFRGDSGKSGGMLIIVGMIFRDYQQSVFREYERLKRIGLPLSLLEPTPAGLRDECLLVCSKRFDRRDMFTLERFFGAANDEASFSKAIERCETDKFRPLVNYMIGKTREPDRIIIELLAWLIDYEGRPYAMEKPPITPGQRGVEPQGDSFQEPRDGGVATPRPVLSVGRVRVIIAGICAVIGIVVFLMYRGKPRECMEWVGDRYVSVPCSIKNDVIPLDSNKLVNFKRITDLKNITRASIGRVWYVKLPGGQIEYYTSDGFDPVFTDRRLKPLTAYMYAKHIDTAR